MERNEHPLTEKLERETQYGLKILVSVRGRLVKRSPAWRKGDWFVRDQYQWVRLVKGRYGYEIKW